MTSFKDLYTTIEQEALTLADCSGYSPKLNIEDEGVVAGIGRFRATHPHLAEHLTDMLFTPLKWAWSDGRHAPSQAIVYQFLRVYLQQQRPVNFYPHLRKRLVQLLTQPYYREIPNYRGYSSPPSGYFKPSVAECLAMLNDPPSMPTQEPERQALIHDILFGMYNTSIPPSAEEPNQQAGYSHTLFGWGMSKGVANLMCSQLDWDYDTWKQCIMQTPLVLRYLPLAGTPKGYLKHQNASIEKMMARPEFLVYAKQLLAEITEDYQDSSFPILKEFKHIVGNQYLIVAGQLLEKHKFKAARIYIDDWVNYDSGYYNQSTLKKAVGRLAQTQTTYDEQTVAQLKQFKPKTLKILLGIASNSAELLLNALGWQSALPLYRTIQKLPESRSEPWPLDLLQSTLAQCDTAIVDEMLTTIAKGGAILPSDVKLIQAWRGQSTDWIAIKFKQRQQLAVIAYSLMPITGGLTETLERYLALQAWRKLSRRYGKVRQVNERAVADVALANLAQVAGFPDAERMRWRLEKQLSEGDLRIGRIWQLDPYTITLALAGCKPELVIEKAGKRLKTTPAALRKSAEYKKEIKPAVEQLREQSRRFRQTFERILSYGETITAADLNALQGTSVAEALLSLYVIRTSDGRLGLPNLTTRTIERVTGTHEPFDGDITIAHPYHLDQANELAAWQAKILASDLVQPSKQVFRELYLITPAEIESHTQSGRFATHHVAGHILSKLLGARGWRELEGRLYKSFPQANIHVTFQTTGRFLHYGGEIQTGTIYFHPAAQRVKGINNAMPLIDVPPLIFSEVMRDADLFVSVAQAEGETYNTLSPEAYETRINLLQQLFAKWHVAGVEIEGRHARVRGKRANYRVHLGSGTIHIEPGNYLCIVPADWGKKKRESLYLPFENGQDRKFSEILSKILLLVNDKKIKDRSILSQIERVT